MLIESVDFQQDEKGSIPTLGLVDPRAYGGEGSKGCDNKSGLDWFGGRDMAARFVFAVFSVAFGIAVMFAVVTTVKHASGARVGAPARVG